MSLTDTEFRVLRETIAARGTVRVALLPVTIAAWALVSGAFLVFTELPFAGVFSLAVLVAGFEAIHALHVGVERIGRYLQVYYETGPDKPRWESTAMRLGPGLPGGGVDPLFTLVFGLATLVNLVPAFVPSPPASDLLALIALHLVFVIRVVRARGAAARQRAVDLETFRALHVEDATRLSQTERTHAPSAGA
jgi:hypothetical protein